jgi:hypothetical protein
VFVRFTLPVVSVSTTFVCPSIFGIEADGFGVVANRLVILAFGRIGISTTFVCPSIFGIEADGFSVIKDRLVILAMLGIGITPFLVGTITRVVDLKFDEAAKIADGLVVFALAAVGRPALTIEPGCLRIEPDGLVEGR